MIDGRMHIFLERDMGKWHQIWQNLLIHGLKRKDIYLSHSWLIALEWTRKENASNWNQVVCPKYDGDLGTSFNVGRSLVVSGCATDVFKVQSDPSMSVHIGNRTCSCWQWQLKDFPCDHAVCAIKKSGKDLEFHWKVFSCVEL